MSNVYKLRHKGTGLFLDPQGSQCNVSVEGKVYSKRKPPRQRFISLPNDIRGDYESMYETELDDWEVVEYRLVEVIKKLEVVKKPIPNYGDLMTMSEFVDNVKCGMFTDDDGCGVYSDGEYILDDKYINIYNIDETKSHVVWYGK